jgi:hypothetical protein
LADLGPQLQRGPRTDASERLESGYSEIDALVGGGFPKGRLSEISGPASSGRTSLALGLLAQVTRAGEMAAVVDGADAFDPQSAEAVGVDLDRVLWARAPAWREALRCCERLLETEGIPLVLLDLASGVQQTGQPSDVAWLRLGRLTTASRSGLVVLSQQRLTGSHAELALELQSTQARFSQWPALLEALEIRAVLARHRALPIERTVSLRLGTRAA